MTLFGFLPRDYAEKSSKIMIIDQICFVKYICVSVGLYKL